MDNSLWQRVGPVGGTINPEEGREWRWSVGLPGFLKHSNENEHNVDFLVGLIGLWKSARRNSDKSTRIVDIGCGSGAKSLGVMKELKDRGIDCNLELIDNDADWLPSVKLATSAADSSLIQTHIPVDANEWLQREGSVADWATLLHVPYSSKTEQLARRVCSRLVERGCVVVASAESENSELALLRNYITEQTGIEVPRPRISALCAWLKRQPWQVWRMEVGGKWLRLPDEELLSKDGWFIELVAGRAITEFAPEAKCALIENVKRGIHQTMRKKLVIIPDDVVVIWKAHD